jgi:phosphoribosylglycinamide formyltransferase-1
MKLSKKNIAIFISGTGSNMRALIEASKKENYPAQIVCVISDNQHAQGLVIAQSFNIQTYFINPNEYQNKQDYEANIHEKLLIHKIDFICLAGFMRLISPYLCDLWNNKMINIHPSLLPSFKGLNSHEKALKAGVKFSGCTIHWVTSKMDSGKIIAQAVVPVLRNDTVNDLSKRVLKAEHKLYPLVLKSVCHNSLSHDILSFFDNNSINDTNI